MLGMRFKFVSTPAGKEQFIQFGFSRKRRTKFKAVGEMGFALAAVRKKTVKMEGWRNVFVDYITGVCGF